MPVDAASGNAGGDEQPVVDNAAGTTADDGAVADEPLGVSAEGAPDDDDADDDDFSDVSYKDDPRFKAVVKKLSKQRRQLARMRPTYSRVKDVDLDTVLTRAKTAEQLQETLTRHPKLAKQVMEAMSGLQPAEGAEAEDVFDPSKLPFSTEDASGKFFAEMVRDFKASQKELRALRAELAGLKQSGQQQTRAGELRSWRDATRAAAEQVPKWARDMFNDAVYGAFREAENRGTRLEPQKVIKHYLSQLPIGDKAKAAATAASAHSAARHNSNLPRVPQSPGVPAGSRKAGETVADVNRRVRGGAYFPR